MSGIGAIEELAAQFQPLRFRQAEVAPSEEVEIHQPRRAQHVAPRIAEGERRRYGIVASIASATAFSSIVRRSNAILNSMPATSGDSDAPTAFETIFVSLRRKGVGPNKACADALPPKGHTLVGNPVLQSQPYRYRHQKFG